MSDEKMIEIRLKVDEYVHNKLKERQARYKEHGLKRKTLPEIARMAVHNDLLREACQGDQS